MWSYLSQGLLDTHQIGPLPDEEFLTAIAEGKIKDSTSVYHPQDTRGQWVEAQHCEAFQKMKESIAEVDAKQKARKEEQKKEKAEQREHAQQKRRERLEREKRESLQRRQDVRPVTAPTMKQRREKMAYALRWFSTVIVVCLPIREFVSMHNTLYRRYHPSDIFAFAMWSMIFYLPIAFAIFTAFRALALVLESFDEEEVANENGS